MKELKVSVVPVQDTENYFNPFGTELANANEVFHYVEVSTKYKGDPTKEPNLYHIRVKIGSLPSDWFEDVDLEMTDQKKRAKPELIETLFLVYRPKHRQYSIVGKIGIVSKQLYEKIILFLNENYGSLWGNSLQ